MSTWSCSKISFSGWSLSRYLLVSLPISRYKNTVASVPDHVTGLVFTVTLKFNTGELLVTVVGGSLVVGDPEGVVDVASVEVFVIVVDAISSVLFLSIAALIFSTFFTLKNHKKDKTHR